MILSELNRKSAEKLTPAVQLFGKPWQLLPSTQKWLTVALAHHSVKELAFTINFNQLPYISSHWLTCWVLVRIMSQVCANHWQKASLIVHLSITNNRNTVYSWGFTLNIQFCALQFLCVRFWPLCIHACQQRHIKRSNHFHERTFLTLNIGGQNILRQKIQASIATLPPKYSIHKHLLVSRILMPTYSWEKWDDMSNKSKCKITAKGRLSMGLTNSVTEVTEC